MSASPRFYQNRRFGNRVKTTYWYGFIDYVKGDDVHCRLIDPDGREYQAELTYNSFPNDKREWIKDFKGLYFTARLIEYSSGKAKFICKLYLDWVQPSPTVLKRRVDHYGKIFGDL